MLYYFILYYITTFHYFISHIMFVIEIYYIICYKHYVLYINVSYSVTVDISVCECETDSCLSRNQNTQSAETLLSSLQTHTRTETLVTAAVIMVTT